MCITEVTTANGQCIFRKIRDESEGVKSMCLLQHLTMDSYDLNKCLDMACNTPDTSTVNINRWAT